MSQYIYLSEPTLFNLAKCHQIYAYIVGNQNYKWKREKIKELLAIKDQQWGHWSHAMGGEPTTITTTGHLLKLGGNHLSTPYLVQGQIGGDLGGEVYCVSHHQPITVFSRSPTRVPSLLWPIASTLICTIFASLLLDGCWFCHVLVGLHVTHLRLKLGFGLGTQA